MTNKFCHKCGTKRQNNENFCGKCNYHLTNTDN